MKKYIKKYIEKKGWFIRKSSGLGAGVSFFYDLENRFNIKPLYVYDIGAHRGETISDFLDYDKNIQITAFEPIKSNYEILYKKYSKGKNIKLENYALSDKEGELTIELQKDSQTNSLKNIAKSKNNSEIIKTIRLDDYINQSKITRIDVLKIDVEGFELQVLSGAITTLRSRKIKSIFLECSIDPNDTVHSNIFYIQNFLIKESFELVAIYDQIVWDSPTRLAYFNCFFIQSELL